MDNLIPYKIHETLLSAKNNLSTKWNNVFVAYKKILEHIKILKKNYTKFFEWINKISSLLEKWENISRLLFSFELSNYENNDIIKNMAYYMSIELTLSLARFYAINSFGWGIHSKILNIFDKNKFYEYDGDLNRINQEFRATNILIIDLEDIIYLSTKNDISKYLNIINSLISMRKNSIKSFDIIIGNKNLIESHINEEQMKLYETLISFWTNPV